MIFNKCIVAVLVLFCTVYLCRIVEKTPGEAEPVEAVVVVLGGGEQPGDGRTHGDQALYTIH